MKSAEFIQQKFQAWAHRKNIMLQGSEGERGQPNYTLSLGENLFRGELHIQARSAFEAGAGGELRGAIPSMCALHSSAAMAVNLLQYWLGNQQFPILAEIPNVPSTGIESVSFERKYPVCVDWKAHGFNEPPHLDLGIDYIDSRRVGVECKLFEPTLPLIPLYSGHLFQYILSPALATTRYMHGDIPLKPSATRSRMRNCFKSRSSVIRETHYSVSGSLLS